MPVLVSDVLADAVVLLNDAAKAIYLDSITFPFLRKAYRELEDKLYLTGSPILDEYVELAITAGTSVLNSGSTPPLPTNLLEPVELRDKQSGAAATTFALTKKERFVPPEYATNKNQIDIWAWREQQLYFNPPLTNRDIGLTYRKSLPALTLVGDEVIPFIARTYLAARTAALAAFFIGENANRAAVLQDDANKALDELIRSNINSEQDLPVRRKGYTGR
jgi:hypothetical protein